MMPAEITIISHHFKISSKTKKLRERNIPISPQTKHKLIHTLCYLFIEMEATKSTASALTECLVACNINNNDNDDNTSTTPSSAQKQSTTKEDFHFGKKAKKGRADDDDDEGSKKSDASLFEEEGDDNDDDDMKTEEDDDDDENKIPLSAESDPLVVLKRISFGWQFALVDFALFKRVGGGRYSTVYHAKYKRLGMDMALKRYVRERLQPHSMEQIAKEIAIHSQMQHASIAPFYGAFMDEHSGDIYLIHEFASRGDVFNALNATTFGRFSETRAAREVIKPLTNAVQYLHARGIVHRDIKPENILVAEASSMIHANSNRNQYSTTYARHTAKLTDFGFACDLNVHKPLARLGTTDYMAPEVVACDRKRREELQKLEQPGYGAAVDTWAIGVLTYELLVGIPPFAGPNSPNREDTYARITKGEYAKVPSFVSDKAKDFIARCLEIDPEKRATAEELLEHEWLVSRTAIKTAAISTSSFTNGNKNNMLTHTESIAANAVEKKTEEDNKGVNKVNNINPQHRKEEDSFVTTNKQPMNLVKDAVKQEKKTQQSSDEPWSSSDESFENEENYVRELASMAAGRSASLAIAGISGTVAEPGSGLYSPHLPPSRLTLMKNEKIMNEKVAPVSPLKQPPQHQPSKKSSTTDNIKKKEGGEVLGFGAQNIDLAGLAALRARYAGEDYESSNTPSRSSSHEERKLNSSGTSIRALPESSSVSMFGKLMQRSQSVITTKTTTQPMKTNNISRTNKSNQHGEVRDSGDDIDFNNKPILVQRSTSSFLQRVKGTFSRRVRNLTGMMTSGRSEYDDRNE